jgi:hypothetical protein
MYRYDLSDPTGQQIVDYMEENGIAFTGAGSRFYDPPRRDLKTVIRSIREGVETVRFTFEYTRSSDNHLLIGRICVAILCNSE